jgi:O-antigen/teichoic acid export membrane protein
MSVVVRQSILTSLISYIGVAVGYVNLLYLYPKFLEPEQIGLMRTIQDAAMLLAPFAQFGLAQSIVRFYPHFSSERTRANTFISLILTLGVCSYGLFLIVFLSLQDNLMGFFDKNAHDILGYTNLILWLTFLLLVFALLEQYSKSLIKIAMPSFLREVGTRILQAILVSIYFLKIITFHQFLLCSILVYVIILVVLAIYLLYQANLRLNFNFQTIPKLKIREILTFSSLSFVGTSAMILIAKMDSIMVTGMIGLASNAVYTTAFYMATVIEVPKRAITNIASPLIANAFERNDILHVSTIYRKTSINQLIIGSLLLIGIWANLHNMFKLMPKGEYYQAGMYVVAIVGVGKLIDMAFGPSSEVIGLSKHYWFNLVVITLLAGLIVITNYLFIPLYGIEGAAYGSVIALVFYNLAKYIFIYVKFRIQPFTSATVKVLLIGAVVALINVFLPLFENVIVDILFRSSIITVVFGTLILLSKSSEDANRLFFSIIRRIGIRIK